MLAEDLGGAGGREEVAGGEVEEGGLAGAVGAEDDPALALLDRPGDLVHQSASVADHGYVHQLQYIAHERVVSPCSRLEFVACACGRSPQGKPTPPVGVVQPSGPVPRLGAMLSEPRSGRLAAWGNALLAGFVSPDDAALAIVGDDAVHRVEGLPGARRCRRRRRGTRLRRASRRGREARPRGRRRRPRPRARRRTGAAPSPRPPAPEAPELRPLEKGREDLLALVRREHDRLEVVRAERLEQVGEPLLVLLAARRRPRRAVRRTGTTRRVRGSQNGTTTPPIGGKFCSQTGSCIDDGHDVPALLEQRASTRRRAAGRGSRRGRRRTSRPEGAAVARRGARTTARACPPARGTRCARRRRSCRLRPCAAGARTPPRRRRSRGSR